MNITKRNERIKQLHANGEKVSALAKRYNVSVQTIYKIVDCSNSEAKESRKERIMTMNKHGYTQKEIAKELGVSQSTIQRAIKESKVAQHEAENPHKTRLALIIGYEGCVIVGTDDTHKTAKKLRRYNGADSYTVAYDLEVTDGDIAEASVVNLLTSLGVPKGDIEVPYLEEKHYHPRYIHQLKSVFESMAAVSPMNETVEEDDDDYY